MIKLGQRVKDEVTGFTGIAVSRVEYLSGCVQFCVKPLVGDDGKMPPGEYVDVQQLSIIDDGVVGLVATPTGGTMPDAPPLSRGPLPSLP